MDNSDFAFAELKAICVMKWETRAQSHDLVLREGMRYIEKIKVMGFDVDPKWDFDVVFACQMPPTMPRRDDAIEKKNCSS